MNESIDELDTKRTDDGSFSGTRRTVLKSMGALGTSAVFFEEIDTASAHETDNHLEMTPALGWNSWNSFGCNVDAELIKATADAMVESGMKDAGYEYINIDDCWMTHSRDENGRLQPDPEKFPNGIEGVADYVHDKGLKLGIYESAGSNTCAGYPGSLKHEQTDAQSFADWGVDYLKYDNCGDHYGLDSQTRYKRMWNALEATGRPIVKSQCSWGSYDEWTWAPDLGSNSWRTTGDISPNWSSVMNILDQQVGLAKYSKPGHWNDPDMLEVGNGGLSTRESRAHFSLWCMLAAPLLAGNDLRDMSEETLNILTNEEALAINQDPMGQQATKRKDSGDQEVWARSLANGDMAVCLLNRSSTSNTISIPVDEFNLKHASAYVLRDTWAKDEVAAADTVVASVPSHGAVLYRVRSGHPNEAPPATTLSLDGSTTIQNGETQTITTTLTNHGRIAIEDVTLDLNAPDGWTATPVDNPTHANTAPSKSVATKWTVTAPNDIVPGDYEFEVDVGFKWQGNRASTNTIGSLHVPLNPLPAGYRSYASTEANFGSNDVHDTLVIDADGEDVYGDTDEYGALYRPDDRAASVSTTVVKIVSQEATSDWAKAGLMIRDDITAAGSSGGYAIVAVTPGNGYTLQWDGDDDGKLEDDQHGGSASYPVWLKLERDGSRVTGYHSTDGSTWNEISSEDVPGMNGMQDIAMFSTSHSGGQLGEVEFTEFSVENAVSASLAHSDNELVVPDETRQIEMTVTNYTTTTLDEVQASLDVPSDWAVDATSPTSIGTLGAGDSASVSWETTLPSDVKYDISQQLTSTVSYRQDGKSHSVDATTSLRIPPAPPTSNSYLSDLDWIDATAGWGDIGRDQSIGGNTLTINGTTYKKGIGTHAPSEIRYYLGSNMSRFTATVGVDDEVSKPDVSSIQYRVIGDGTTLAKTDVLSGNSNPVDLDVDISNIDILNLVVATTGDTKDYDHADWTNARVLR